MKRKSSSDFPPQVLDLFDRLVHGGITRREFLEQAAAFAATGLCAATMLDGLSSNYALAQQVAADDSRIKTERVSYESKAGYGTVKGLLARPAQGERFPGVLVVHENRGLNPYIEDVARRLATEGFVALAPDGLTSLGGYPGTDDKGRELQRTLDQGKLVEDFLAGAKHLAARGECTANVGVTGFCFGGMVANQLAVRLPTLGAAVPFYGRQPSADEVARIKAPLLIHYAENDERVNAGWADYKQALEANTVRFTAHTYPGTDHGFHNDTTPRYDEAAAKLAWKRTLEFFRAELR